MIENPRIPLTSIHRIEADGVSVFYRQAGPADAPIVLLLHGFPTSSFQYRELIPRLADRYRVIAPDLPGFGFTVVPEERRYKYTFDSLAKTMLAFTDALNLTKYAMYIFDYGAPTGLRVAMQRPERVTAIVSQNGNAYEEGLGDAWQPIQRYWREPTQEHRNAIRAGLNLEGLRHEYSVGIPDPTLIKPEGYTLDAALLARPGNVDIQLDLFLDYANNVKLYPKFQEYFRSAQPPLLAVWGKFDPYFIPPGAEAFLRDNPNATVQFLETGHFALETHLEEVASAMREFLQKALGEGRKIESHNGNATVRNRDCGYGRGVEISGLDAWQAGQAGCCDRTEVYRRLMPQYRLSAQQERHPQREGGFLFPKKRRVRNHQRRLPNRHVRGARSQAQDGRGTRRHSRRQLQSQRRGIDYGLGKIHRAQDA